MGSQRPWGLYRHLAAHGWDPVILTASAGDNLPNVIRIPHRRPAERVRSVLGLQPDAHGFIASALRWVRRRAAEIAVNPEDESGWQASALEAGLERLANETFDAILSTSPPTTTHLVARDLKKRTGLPWAADLRDLWVENYSYPWSELRQAVDRRIERSVLSDTDALITVSEPLAETLRARYPQPIRSISNGFAPEEAARPGHPLSDRLTITYTGTLYWKKQDPVLLFETLASLATNGQIDLNKIDVRLYGRNIDQASLHSAVARHGLRRHVITGGLLARAEVLELQRESQILLTLDWMDERQPGVYTGKIFEYLAAGRPILSIGPPGSVVDSLLQETGAGRQCGSVPQLKAFLLESYAEFDRTKSVSYRGDREAVKKHDHVAMARQFSEILDSVATQGHAHHRQSQG